MKRVLVEAVLVIAAFGIGYIPKALEASNARTETARVQADLLAKLNAAESRYRSAELAGILGMVLIDINHENYGSARQRSTIFFDHVRDAGMAANDDAVKMRLNSILDQRDAITATLAANKPDAAAKVQELFMQLPGVTPSLPPGQ